MGCPFIQSGTAYEHRFHKDYHPALDRMAASNRAWLQVDIYLNKY